MSTTTGGHLAKNAIDVRGDETGRFLLLIHQTTGEILGAAYRCEDRRWWVGKDISGKHRQCYAPVDAPDPRMHIASQLINV
ncbi:hypothetical protein [Actinomadura opuntiae]|uniref:hypothetical protein n=1 Tax=Actinomadura sp. OS1-43 TaxID=604315 RepID=UPI00255A7E8E|nr:hypothetical protein [Actinomadura sp. OS1-43]MDL4812840.1 hypothetical protein [Actinomadura sp. OS1-43]